MAFLREGWLPAGKRSGQKEHLIGTYTQETERHIEDSLGRRGGDPSGFQTSAVRQGRSEREGKRRMKRKKKKKSGWLGVKSGAWRMLSVAVLAAFCLGAGQARAVAQEWTVVYSVEKSGAEGSSAGAINPLSLVFKLLQTNASGQTSTVSTAITQAKVADISATGGFTVQVVFTLPDSFDPADGTMSVSITGSQKGSQTATLNKGVWTSVTTTTWTPEALQALLQGGGTSSGNIFTAADYAIDAGGTSVRATPEPSGAMVFAFLASALALKRRRQSR